MAKRKALFGVNNFEKKKRRKRPGRVAKSPNKNIRKKEELDRENQVKLFRPLYSHTK